MTDHLEDQGGPVARQVNDRAPNLPAVGELWAYRHRDDDPSQRVLVRAATRDKRKVRIEVEFMDGLQTGTRLTVPGTRLRVPWEQVEAFDQLMANWKRLRDSEKLDDVESAAASMAFDLLVPAGVAELAYRPVENAVEVHDRSRLDALLGISTADLEEQHDTFRLEGDLVLAPSAALLIAEHACRRFPQPVLDMVLKEEAEAREKCKRGGTHPGWERSETTRTSPEWEYRWYLEYDRPRHELLRQWCGHKAVSGYERLLAAEAECHRLDELLARTLDALRTDGRDGLADALEREHEQERITAYNVRPVPDRPLQPWEIPVREVPTRRRWW